MRCSHQRFSCIGSVLSDWQNVLVAKENTNTQLDLPLKSLFLTARFTSCLSLTIKLWFWHFCDFLMPSTMITTITRKHSAGNHSVNMYDRYDTCVFTDQFFSDSIIIMKPILTFWFSIHKISEISVIFNTLKAIFCDGRHPCISWVI